MYCSKCGNELKEEDLFCNKCGNKIEQGLNTNNNAVKKEHWIKNTKLAIKCRENKNIRTMVATIIVLVVLVLIITAISHISISRNDEDYLAMAQSTNDTERIEKYNSKITTDRVIIGASIVGSIVVWYYGKKIVEK